ncbi:MAG: AI-2E family transporter [Candidatus Moranbacteria bacterium]|nr:AI-2E family transporter [Candidatus Moranbacteria bacterium]
MIEKRQVEISMGVVFRTVLLVIAIWFLFMIREVLALLFVAILIVTAIDPIVDHLQKKKIPRTLGVSAVYAALALLIVAAVSFIMPPLISQSADFAGKIPSYLQGIGSYTGSANSYFHDHSIALNVQQIADSLNNEIASLPRTIFSETVGLVHNVISVIIVLVMAFYMTVKEDGIKKFIISITPEKHKDYAASLTDRAELKIGKWVQGQFFLMFIIFVIDFVGLSIIGIPYALPLAIFAGIMEIVPYVGPIVSAVPGIILGLLISPMTGLITLLLYFFAQQFESHIVVPQVMKKAVGLNPIAVILALLIGLKLGGILGAILSIPLATVVSVFVEDMMKKE